MLPFLQQSKLQPRLAVMASLDKLASMDGWDVGEDVTGMPYPYVHKRTNRLCLFSWGCVFCLQCIFSRGLDPCTIWVSLRCLDERVTNNTATAAKVAYHRSCGVQTNFPPDGHLHQHTTYPFRFIASFCDVCTWKMDRLAARPLQSRDHSVS